MKLGIGKWLVKTLQAMYSSATSRMSIRTNIWYKKRFNKDVDSKKVDKTLFSYGKLICSIWGKSVGGEFHSLKQLLT